MAPIARGDLPKYRQLQHVLRERISARRWRVGDRIPTERDLCKVYRVSRATVRQALDGLTAEGIIERRQGSGSYVAAPRIEQSLGRLYSFSQEMLAKGLRPGLRLLDAYALPAPAAVAERLEVPPGEELYRLVRLRLANDEPLMYERCFLPARYCPGLLEEDLGARLLHDLFAEKYGRPFARQRKWVEPVLAEPEIAAQLGVAAGSPALRIERMTYSAKDEPLEYREIVVRGDRSRYFIEVHRP